MKPKRGQKTCKTCDEINGARAYTCKKCGTPFVMKNGRVHYGKGIVKDWRTLEPGDCIRVKGRSGPYYIKQNGEKSYFASAGVYRVIELREEGIEAVGVDGRVGGFYYLYMGPEKPSPIGLECCFSAPHRVSRVKDIYR